MESIIEDSYVEPITYSLALVSSSQVPEQTVEHPNNAPDLLIFVLQKLSTTLSKPQRAMVLRDILIHVGGIGHWRNDVIKVGQEFVEAEKSWADLGVTKEELFEEIRYEDIVQPAIAEFHKTVARQKRAIDRVEASWGEDWRMTIDPNIRTFPAEESKHFLASFARLSGKTTASHVAKIVKDTMNNRINHPRRGVRSTTFITVSDLQKAEMLIRAIATTKEKGKQKLLEKGGTGTKRKHSELTLMGDDSDNLSADAIIL